MALPAIGAIAGKVLGGGLLKGLFGKLLGGAAGKMGGGLLSGILGKAAAKDPVLGLLKGLLGGK